MNLTGESSRYARKHAGTWLAYLPDAVRAGLRDAVVAYVEGDPNNRTAGRPMSRLRSIHPFPRRPAGGRGRHPDAALRIAASAPALLRKSAVTACSASAASVAPALRLRWRQRAA